MGVGSGERRPGEGAEGAPLREASEGAGEGGEGAGDRPLGLVEGACDGRLEEGGAAGAGSGATGASEAGADAAIR